MGTLIRVGIGVQVYRVHLRVPEQRQASSVGVAQRLRVRHAFKAVRVDRLIPRRSQIFPDHAAQRKPTGGFYQTDQRVRDFRRKRRDGIGDIRLRVLGGFVCCACSAA